MTAENAVIMAAGTSSRFAPLSYETHKAFTVVRGEALIERQIRQLREAGIKDVTVVTGYKAEQFDRLRDDFGVRLIHNPEYRTRNNHSSLWAAREVLGSTYVCSADNYFTENPFTRKPQGAYYAAQYAQGPTAEWCLTEGEDGFIDSVTIGGRDAWYMLGHTFWSRSFTAAFLKILEEEYDRPETRGKLWESLYREHLDVLKMTIGKYPPGVIQEFDTLDELRLFDESYVTDTRSRLLKRAAAQLSATEEMITHVTAVKGADNEAAGFAFDCAGKRYRYLYEEGRLTWQN